jgi:protein tyrosine/serine phosphatase
VLDLGIKTLICVRNGGPDRQLREFAAAHQLNLHSYDLDRAGCFDHDATSAAAKTALDPAAQPALVCCDGGRHHVGIVVALLRLQTGHCLESALAEYFSYAAPSPYPDNVLFIVRAATHDAPAVVAPTS